jgi:uncharacterized membrane protein YedE/YeeE
MESLTFVAPLAYTVDWLILFSDKSKVLTLGIVTTWAWSPGRRRGAGHAQLSAGKVSPALEDTANHLVGAVLMGVGGVVAMGCTIGQGLSGLSTLALGSFIATLASWSAPCWRALAGLAAGASGL